MTVRIIPTLAEREIKDRRVVVLDTRKATRGQTVYVGGDGWLVSARVLAGGEWVIAVCEDGAGK